MHQANGSFEVVHYSYLPTLTKSEGAEDMKVMRAWKAPRKGSTQGLEMCRKEAIGNVSVFFFMNHLGI